MGLDWEFNLHFDRIKADMATAIDPALERGMQALRTVVTPLVPLETGDLAGSGDVGIGDLDDPAVEHVTHLYYPGPYALYQHNGVYFRRPATYGVPLNHTQGESFFLERPAASEGPAIIRMVGDELKGTL